MKLNIPVTCVLSLLTTFYTYSSHAEQSYGGPTVTVAVENLNLGYNIFPSLSLPSNTSGQPYQLAFIIPQQTEIFDGIKESLAMSGTRTDYPGSQNAPTAETAISTSSETTSSTEIPSAVVKFYNDQFDKLEVLIPRKETGQQIVCSVPDSTSQINPNGLPGCYTVPNELFSTSTNFPAQLTGCTFFGGGCPPFRGGLRQPGTDFIPRVPSRRRQNNNRRGSDLG